MHPTWKRHSTPLHSPLRCYRFFSSPLSYLFSLSLTLPSPTRLHLISPVSCTALSLSLLGFLVSLKISKCPHSAAVFSSSLCPLPIPSSLFPFFVLFSSLLPTRSFSFHELYFLSSPFPFRPYPDVPGLLFGRLSVCKQIFRRLKTELLENRFWFLLLGLES